MLKNFGKWKILSFAMTKQGDVTYEMYQEPVEEAKHHNKLYYIDNAPEISDYEFDRLLNRIEAIEKEHPDWLIDSSPTAKVGSDVSKGFKTVAHTSPMLSLANTYSEEELGAWVKRMQKFLEKKEPAFHAELKIDGVAVAVRYKKGKLVRAITRGDGTKGDDVTQNARGIENLHHTLKGKFPDELEVRGEIFIPHAVFQKLNREKEEAGEMVYANPRNAASGSLKLLDSSETKKRCLHIKIYDVDGKSGILQQSEVAPLLEKMGLPVFDDDERKRCTNLQEILAFARMVEKKRRAVAFDIDGIVVKLDDIRARGPIGATGKTPRWAVAYKFGPERAESVVESIVVQVGRTGVLTPVAHLKPTRLMGSVIARATLHNQEEIE